MPLFSLLSRFIRIVIVLVVLNQGPAGPNGAKGQIGSRGEEVGIKNTSGNNCKPLIVFFTLFLFLKFYVLFIDVGKVCIRA